jgi:hypothetical protein
MAFDKPDAPGRDSDAPQFNMTEHLGDLLVIQVTDIQTGVVTEYGERDVIVADVHVIGRDSTISATYEQTWLFGTVLFSQLKGKRGRTVLGVLEQGEKRPGKKPPWRLADPTDAQEAAALKAMSSKPDAPEEGKPADPWTEPAAAAAGGKAPWE